MRRPYVRSDVGDQAVDRGSVLGGKEARDSASNSSVVARGGGMPEPVSYTHLTLPTICSV
eukprot:1265260-Alexandrium_andersonii.AAC.1